MTVTEEAFNQLKAEVREIRQEIREVSESQHKAEIATARREGFNAMLPWIGTIVVGLAALGAYLVGGH